AVPVMRHPQHAVGPRQAGMAIAVGRRQRGQHLTCLRVDLAYLIAIDLVERLAVERRSRRAWRCNGASRRARVRINGLQAVTGGQPDMPAIVSNSVNLLHLRERTMLVNDFGCFAHAAPGW